MDETTAKNSAFCLGRCHGDAFWIGKIWSTLLMSWNSIIGLTKKWGIYRVFVGFNATFVSSNPANDWGGPWLVEGGHEVILPNWPGRSNASFPRWTGKFGRTSTVAIREFFGETGAHWSRRNNPYMTEENEKEPWSWVQWNKVGTRWKMGTLEDKKNVSYASKHFVRWNSDPPKPTHNHQTWGGIWKTRAISLRIFVAFGLSTNCFNQSAQHLWWALSKFWDFWGSLLGRRKWPILL